MEALVKFVESGGTEGNEAGDDDEDVSTLNNLTPLGWSRAIFY